MAVEEAEDVLALALEEREAELGGGEIPVRQLAAEPVAQLVGVQEVAVEEKRGPAVRGVDGLLAVLEDPVVEEPRAESLVDERGLAVRD